MSTLSASSANQFIGSRISLTSKSDIRYEGTLYCLDLGEATISLAKVRSHGTEDRPTDRPIPMKDEIYEFIIFRGSDIKSIDVMEPPKQGSTMPCGLPQDPAIIEQSSGDRGRNYEHNIIYQNREAIFDGLLRGGRGQSHGTYRGASNDTGIQVDRRNNGRNYNNRNMDGRSRQDNYRGGSGGGNQSRGRGNTPNRNRDRDNRDMNHRDNRDNRASSGNRGQQTMRQRGILEPHGPPKVTFDAHFDFEKANEELKNAMEKATISENDDIKKEGEGGSAASEEKAETPISYYVKDKFFDNISCEALERNKGKGSRVDWRAERKLNAETFGLTFNPNGNNQQRGGNRIYSNSYRPRVSFRGDGGYRGGFQPRYNNYNRYNNRNNSSSYGNSYGSRDQQQQRA